MKIRFTGAGFDFFYHHVLDAYFSDGPLPESGRLYSIPPSPVRVTGLEVSREELSQGNTAEFINKKTGRRKEVILLGILESPSNKGSDNN